ncbi:MAG: hypothetical protein LAP40_25485 [Acidobacteriia bacterium]|nr:hypothetical protein [Terriglobia bacterium]
MTRNRILIVAGIVMAGACSASAQLAAPAAPSAPVGVAAPLPPAAPVLLAVPAPPTPAAFPAAAPVPPQPIWPDLLSDDIHSQFPAWTDQLAQVQVNVQAQVAQARAQAEQARELARQQRFVFTGFNGRGDDGLYSNGQRALDRSQWDEALGNFNRVAANGGPRADGALYWKAYTLNKLGRRDEANAAIAELRKSYPNSRWLDDAKALEMEVQQAAGQNVSPESQSDEELKLMAVNALVRSDPDRAIPLLENLLKSAQGPRLKERALFVLGQSDAARAQQLLEQVARGGGNPDIQVTAINYLGAIERKKGNNQTLLEIYNSSNDVNVKRAVLGALRSAGDADHLLQAVKGEKSADLRSEGVRMLGSRPETGDGLVSLYGSEQDLNVKRAIADSLTAQRNAKALVDLARKETNREMKLDLVRRLSNMQSKEATDYMLEILK